MLAVTEDAELDEDGYVLDHGAEGADKPGEVGEEVVLLDRVEEDLRDVRSDGWTWTMERTPAP